MRAWLPPARAAHRSCGPPRTGLMLEVAGAAGIAVPLRRSGLDSRLAALGNYRNLLKANGGRYRIRTYDFHRVKMALYR